LEEPGKLEGGIGDRTDAFAANENEWGVERKGYSLIIKAVFVRAEVDWREDIMEKSVHKKGAKGAASELNSRLTITSG